MSLTEAVKFRHLSSQLNQKELQSALQKIALQSPNLIISSLFEHFAKSSSSTETIKEVENTNDLISEIIQNRKHKQKQKAKQTDCALPISKQSLHRIPTALIGEVASFLSQSTYFAFMRVSRSCYLACNQPNKLASLKLPNLENAEKTINLARFTSAECLALQCPSFLKNVANTKSCMTALNTLLIDSQEEKSFYAEIDAFTKSGIINFGKIKALCFVWLWQDDAIKVLSNFPNLQKLHLQVLSEQLGADDVDLPSLPQLTALSISGWNDFEENMVRAHLPQLVSLEIEDPDTYYLKTLNFTAGRLKELSLGEMKTEMINVVFQNEMKLQKVHLSCSFKDDETDKIESSISNVFTSCKSLEYFGAELSKHAKRTALDKVLAGIEFGLFRTTKVHRTRFKINMEAPWHFAHVEDSHLFALRIVRIINCLQTGNVDNFMFIWSAPKISINTYKDEEYGYLKQTVDTLAEMLKNVVVRQEDGFTFVISNKDCAICGYQEPFLTD